ncbi:hypothetical protein WA171_004077, partial [Blastocystis sp. BT1]
MDQQEIEESNESMNVGVQEIGGRYFLEMDNNLLSLEELSKYRKVFIANNLFYIYIYMGLSVLILVNSFFLSLVHVIISGVLNFLSGIIIYYSFRSKSTHYSVYACTGLIVGVLSCGIIIFTLNTNGKSPIFYVTILLECIIEFFVLMMLSFILTRIQTILRIVPTYLYTEL